MPTPDPITCITRTDLKVSELPARIMPPTLSSWEDIARATNEFFEPARYLQLPTQIIIPSQSSEFTGASALAFARELDIRQQLIEYRNSLIKEETATFDNALLQFPLTRNLLLRILAAENCSSHLAAGICIGSFTSEPSLGNELLLLLSRPFAMTGGQVSETLKKQCLEWGRHQAAARSLILQETWRSLIGRDDWPVPSGFAKHICLLLEDEFAAAPNSGKSFFPLHEAAYDRYDNWLCDVELLNERRRENPSGLHPVEWQGVPRQTGANACNINQVVISSKQALDHWSTYLSIQSLKEVHIEVPLPSHSLGFTSNPRSYEESFQAEMAALARNPIAPLIRDFRVAAENMTVEEASLIFRGWLSFIITLSAESTWRSAEKQQDINLTFTNPEYEVIEYLQTQGKTSQSVGLLTIGATEDRIMFEQVSVIIPATMHMFRAK